MKDVRQLVHDHEAQPTVVVLQVWIGRGGWEENGDAVRRIDRREAVGRVGFVGERQVDAAARHVQLRRQQAVRALRFPRRLVGDGAIRGTKMDPEVLRV